MKYAVFATGGKQYKVSEGDTLSIELLSEAIKDTHTFNDVLLVANNEDITVGTPFVSGATIAATILGVKKDKKIRVSKFKAKARYRRVSGFRKHLSEIKITGIHLPGEKAQSPQKAQKAPVEKKVVKKRTTK